MRVLGCLGTCGPQHFKLTVQLVSFAELLRGLTQGAVPKLPGIVLFTAIVLTMKALGGENLPFFSHAEKSPDVHTLSGHEAHVWCLATRPTTVACTNDHVGKQVDPPLLA